MFRIISAGTSLFLPGLGHVFYGKLGPAICWFGLSIVAGPLAGVGAALHIMFTPE